MWMGPLMPRMSRLVETVPVAGWAGRMRAELLLAMTKLLSVDLTIEVWGNANGFGRMTLRWHARTFALERLFYFVLMRPEIVDFLQSEVLEHLRRGTQEVGRNALGNFVGQKIRSGY